MSHRFSIPDHRAHAEFESWASALLLAAPDADLPHPVPTAHWKSWVDQASICPGLTEHHIPSSMFMRDWREWVDNLMAVIS